MLSIDNLTYFYHFLYHVLIAHHIFSLSVLKTQILANPVYLLGPHGPQILFDIECISLPEQKLFFLFPLVFISIPRIKFLQDIDNWIWGYPLPSSSMHSSQSLPTTWQFHHLKSSPVFSLLFSQQCLTTDPI